MSFDVWMCQCRFSLGLELMESKREQPVCKNMTLPLQLKKGGGFNDVLKNTQEKKTHNPLQSWVLLPSKCLDSSEAQQGDRCKQKPQIENNKIQPAVVTTESTRAVIQPTTSHRRESLGFGSVAQLCLIEFHQMAGNQNKYPWHALRRLCSPPEPHPLCPQSASPSQFNPLNVNLKNTTFPQGETSSLRKEGGESCWAGRGDLEFGLQAFARVETSAGPTITGRCSERINTWNPRVK